MNQRGADQERRHQVYESLHNRYAEPALNLALHLRGLYVKMGQILSSRPDFMPSQYIRCFTQLQDSIPAVDVEEIQQKTIEYLERSCPAFADYNIELEADALGSASIGQVHRATLTKRCDGGKVETPRVMAVKVMHEGAQARFQHDFQVFRWLCRLIIPSWCSLLDALEQQVMTEFDYRNEAASLDEVRRNMLVSPYRSRVVVPKPYRELTCREVLVMELLDGKKLADSIKDKFAAALGRNGEAATEILARRRHEVITGEDAGSQELVLAKSTFLGKLRLLLLLRSCRKAIELLVDCHGYQIFQNGIWNGDPHFGKSILSC